jgi:hypothetical protein
MALTLQLKPTRTGSLSKAQPWPQRVRVVEKPRKHHLLRGFIVVGNTIAALLRRLRVEEKPKKRRLLRNKAFVGSMFAAAAFVAVVVWWRRGPSNGVADEDRRDAQFTSPKPPDVAPDGDVVVTDTAAPQDLAITVPA